MHTAYLGLGSNLKNPIKQIKTAISYLANYKKSNVYISDLSSFYKSPPLDNSNQPNYINAVVKITTNLSVYDLLSLCQNIENIQFRERKYKWAARTIDIDILLYDNICINDDILTIPHYAISERDFVLVPLYEISSNLNIITFGKVELLINKINNSNLVKIIDKKFLLKLI